MTNKLITKGSHSPIITDSTFTFDMKLKHKNVMERKEKIYIPLIEELKISFVFPNGNLFSKLELPFLKEVLDKQYLYRLDDELLCDFKNFYKLILKFNKLDLTYIAANIITSSFLKGFYNLYGQIIDGQMPIYDNQGDLVDWEDIEPEEFDNIRLISFDTESIIELIKHQYDYDYSFDAFWHDCENELNINPYLTKFYEFALAKRNKKNSPERKQLIDWNGSPENYIAYNFDFYSDFYSDKKVIEKKAMLSKLEESRANLLNKLDNILRYIFVNYEKE